MFNLAVSDKGRKRTSGQPHCVEQMYTGGALTACHGQQVPGCRHSRKAAADDRKALGPICRSICTLGHSPETWHAFLESMMPKAPFSRNSKELFCQREKLVSVREGRAILMRSFEIYSRDTNLP